MKKMYLMVQLSERKGRERENGGRGAHVLPRTAFRALRWCFQPCCCQAPLGDLSISLLPLGPGLPPARAEMRTVFEMGNQEERRAGLHKGPFPTSLTAQSPFLLHEASYLPAGQHRLPWGSHPAAGQVLASLR